MGYLHSLLCVGIRLLFFVGLNNYRSADLAKDNPAIHALIGDVPFLNGGLFTEEEYDKKPDITIPDEAVSAILRDLFECYNFTVMESTPLDQEVAVDPEMLGKVFEELVTGRHESGSYYTPRPVVSFMCREALKGYLQGKASNLPAEAVQHFVDQHDVSGLNLTSAEAVRKALEDIKVVDPACGSGAYLLGMMHELVELETALYSEKLLMDAKSLYDLKLRIIEKNVYGADIDQFAVNIAMLRLWLSLAIDYESFPPLPLPNLDFKIVCGDSLTAPDPNPSELNPQYEMFREQARSVSGKLADLKHRHMYPGDADKRQLAEEIRGEMANLKAALAFSPAPDDAVDWRISFSEVFDQNGGFDVVVANPPYGIEAMSRYSNVTKARDSYTAFMLLATELAPTGTFAYITPTSWETGERFAAFRKALMSRAQPQVIVNLPYDVFDTPYVDTAVTIAHVSRSNQAQALLIATLDKKGGVDFDNIASKLETIPWKLVTSDALHRIPLTSKGTELLSSLLGETSPLGHMADTKRGIEAYLYTILEHPAAGAVEYFTGNVYRYRVVPGKDCRFVHVADLDRRYHEGERILLRRIVSRANRLQAARTDASFCSKKDLYSIKLKSHQDSSCLVWLLAVLNSELMSYLYLSRSAAATKDDFRQITLSGLRELPLCVPEDWAVRNEVERLVTEVEDTSGPTEKLEQRLDSLVYQVYGIGAGEQDNIHTWLARPG